MPGEGEVEVTLEEVKEGEEQEEIIDPGQAEGLPKRDKRTEQENITEDHPRFKKVYAKLKDAERKLAERDAKDKERDKLIDEMRQHNRSLADKVGVLETSATTTIGKEGEFKDNSKEIEESITKLKKDKKVALEAYDHEKVAEIDEELIDAKIALKESRQRKAEASAGSHASGKNAPASSDGSKKLTASEQADIDAFIANTPWYNEDPFMQDAMHKVDSFLANHPSWKGKPLAERLVEGAKRVEKQFNYKSADEGSTGASSVEAGVSYMGGGGVGKGVGRKVTLTAEEVRLSNAFGITAEEYARQKYFGGGR